MRKTTKYDFSLTSASSVALGLKFLKFNPNSLEKIQIFAKSRLKKSVIPINVQIEQTIAGIMRKPPL